MEETPHRTPNLTTQTDDKITNNNDEGNIMSLPKSDVRSKVDPNILKMLRIISEHQDKTIQEVSSLMLEKSVIAEFHVLMVTVRKIKRSGISGLMGDD